MSLIIGAQEELLLHHLAWGVSGTFCNTTETVGGGEGGGGGGGGGGGAPQCANGVR